MTALIEATVNNADERTHPTVVRLSPLPGVAPSNAPPVRIFLGTEDAQYKAERIFLYSIEQVRDPARAYEIHLMKNLAGFNRRWWRTGFTNYRFAIPDFAGRRGRAIYNDVDQVYTADPALLFDLDMEDHGYLAVSPADTSVMLIDCQRMARWWNRAAASRRHKHRLTRGPAREPGLWGALDPGWNARDGEYIEGRSMLLHFTALHTQPWQPAPDRYSYRPHPLGEVWHRLKRAADEQGYTVFTAEHPGPGYHALLAAHRARAAPGGASPPWSDAARHRLRDVDPGDCWQISVGSGGSDEDAACHRRIDLASEHWPRGAADAVLVRDCLERLPAEDIPWVLGELFGRARRLLCIAVRCGPGGHTLADGSNIHQCRRPPDWWREQVLAAARHAPRVDWHLELYAGIDSDRRLVRCTSRAVGTDPCVLLLLEDDAPADAAGRRLAEVLGWSWREQAAAEDGGAPDGADLVLTAGPRGTRRARHWRRVGGIDARLVHLGPPGVPMAVFDLVISRPQDQLPIRDNVQYLARPLSPVDAGTLADAGQRLRPAIESLPRPWIGVLAGGGDLSSALDGDSARELGRQAREQAHALGGSLIIAPFPGVRPDVIDALHSAAGEPMYRSDPDAAEASASYHGCLALADRFIVTGDSADALAAACAGDRPVAVFELAPRLDSGSRWARSCQWLLDRSIRHTSHRGTPRQQDWRGRIHDWLITSGRMTRTHDPRPLLESCLASGLATRLGDETTGDPRAPAPPPPDKLVRRRIRRLLSYQCI